MKKTLIGLFYFTYFLMCIGETSSEFKPVEKLSKLSLADVAGDLNPKFDTVIQRLKRNDILLRPLLLLEGATGTGKTFLVEALAGELNRKIISQKLFFDGYIGSGPKFLEKLFDYAKSQNEPVIVFIDEFHSLFSRYNDHTNQEYKEFIGRFIEILNTLPNDLSIFFVAATNHPELIDDAVASRFENYKIVLDIPDQATRFALLKSMSTRNNLNLSDAIIEQLAEATQDFCPRHIKDITDDVASHQKLKNYPEHELGAFFKRMIDSFKNNKVQTKNLDDALKEAQLKAININLEFIRNEKSLEQQEIILRIESARQALIFQKEMNKYELAFARHKEQMNKYELESARLNRWNEEIESEYRKKERKLNLLLKQDELRMNELQRQLQVYQSYLNQKQLELAVVASNNNMNRAIEQQQLLAWQIEVYKKQFLLTHSQIRLNQAQTLLAKRQRATSVLDSISHSIGSIGSFFTGMGSIRK